MILIGEYKLKNEFKDLYKFIEIRGFNNESLFDISRDISLGLVTLIKGEKNSLLRGLHKFRLYSSLKIPSLILDYGEAEYELKDDFNTFKFHDQRDFNTKLNYIFDNFEIWENIRDLNYKDFNFKYFNLKNNTKLKQILKLI